MAKCSTNHTHSLFHSFYINISVYIGQQRWRHRHFDVKSTLENDFGLHHTELKIFFFRFFLLLYIFSVCCVVVPKVNKSFRSVSSLSIYFQGIDRNGPMVENRPHILRTFLFETKTTTNSDYQLFNNSKTRSAHIAIVSFSLH